MVPPQKGPKVRIPSVHEEKKSRRKFSGSLLALERCRYHIDLHRRLRQAPRLPSISWRATQALSRPTRLHNRASALSPPRQPTPTPHHRPDRPHHGGRRNAGRPDNHNSPSQAPTTKPATATPSPAPSATLHRLQPLRNSTSGYKDGTYVGVGTSRHGSIEVTVVIQSGKIAPSLVAVATHATPAPTSPSGEAGRVPAGRTGQPRFRRDRQLQRLQDRGCESPGPGQARLVKMPDGWSYVQTRVYMDTLVTIEVAEPRRMRPRRRSGRESLWLVRGGRARLQPVRPCERPATAVPDRRPPGQRGAAAVSRHRDGTRSRAGERRRLRPDDWRSYGSARLQPQLPHRRRRAPQARRQRGQLPRRRARPGARRSHTASASLLDLGAVAKGFAIDLAGARARRPCGSFAINAGGDSAPCAAATPQRPGGVGIRHPRRPTD